MKQRAQNPISLKTFRASGSDKARLHAGEYAHAVALAERALDIHTRDELTGCGEFGCAAPLYGRDGMVVKITTDQAEVRAVAAIARNQAYDGFARVYKGPVVLPHQSGTEWSAYTREVVPAATVPMPRYTWNYLIALDQAQKDQSPARYAKELQKFWVFAREHRALLGIAKTARALFRDGYLLGDFHRDNYGMRGKTFVLFDAVAVEFPRGSVRLANPVKKRKPLPEGIESWFEAFHEKGAPQVGERGHVSPSFPYDAPGGILEAVHLWSDHETGPALQELLAYEGYLNEDEYGGELLDEEDRFFQLEDVPLLLGIPEASTEDAAHILSTVFRTLAEVPPDEAELVPEFVQVAIVGDALDEHRRARPRLVNVSKEMAREFIASHHSALPVYQYRGLQYAIGVAVGQRLVAVATAGTPSGQFRARSCSSDGILELSRIASDGTTKGASSMLAARVLDLLPKSGRRGVDGCLFVTYSLLDEAGTTYLALADKGLRPVGIRRATKATGSRKGATDAALRSEDKIVWEAGPAALPPDWDVLAKTTAGSIAGAKKQFEAWEEREAKAARRLSASRERAEERATKDTSV